MNNDLISRSAALNATKIAYIECLILDKEDYETGMADDLAVVFASDIKALPAVDAVEVDVLKTWLYKIAMNNTDNYLCDACEEIISRLDGLRVFARERKENG